MRLGKPVRRAALTAKAQTAADRVREFVQRTFLGRWLGLLIQLHFVDRSVALAAKGLLVLLPALVTVAAIAPEPMRAAIVDTMERRLGLSRTSLDLLQSGMPFDQPANASAGVLASLLTLLYASTFTTALRRMFLNTWHRIPVRDPLIYAKGLVWLGAVVALFWVTAVLLSLPDSAAGRLVVVVLAWVGNLALWWCTAFVMLQGTVRWRVLLPPAVVTTVVSGLYGVAANVWMPPSIVANGNQFGYFGVFMTVASWMTGLAFVVVCATALGPVLAYDRGRIGRLVRGSADVDTVDAPGAPPRVAAPAQLVVGLGLDRRPPSLGGTQQDLGQQAHDDDV